MPSAGFEPAIPATKPPQSYALMYEFRNFKLKRKTFLVGFPELITDLYSIYF
jgi:hypothetical protein